MLTKQRLQVEVDNEIVTHLLLFLISNLDSKPCCRAYCTKFVSIGVFPNEFIIGWLFFCLFSLANETKESGALSKPLNQTVTTPGLKGN